jgi:hypothetical protein
MSFMMPPAVSQQSAIAEWAILTRQILDAGQQLIDSFSRVRRVATFNDLDALIEGTEPGQKVGDSGLTREQALVVRAVLASFGVWLETPIADVPEKGMSVTPIAAMSRRG